MDIQDLKTLWSSTLSEAEIEQGDPDVTRRGARSSVSETYSASRTVDTRAPLPATAIVPPPTPPAAAELPSGFEEIGELARGGMGVVLRARQKSLKREIAIKRSLSSSLNARAAFLGEALTTAFLDHPNIVPVHQLEEGADGQFSLAMKLVGGTEWKDLLRGEDPPSLDENLLTLLKVCDAVAFAHSRGVVHCDLKPENVMVGAFNEVLVMDWGVAVDIRGPRADGVVRARPRESLGGPFGTPSYMAPEMAKGLGEAIDERTDVYLLGAILYELLTGAPPHRESSFLKTLVKASSGAKPVLPATVPEELRGICVRSMAGEKAWRYASVKELQTAIEDYLGHRESLRISDEAELTLAECRRNLSAAGGLSNRRRIALYARFAEAVAGFRQAQSLWAENPRALTGEREAHIEYAEAALDGDDLGLAEAQAESLEKGSEKKRLRELIAGRKAEKARAARNARLMRRSVVGLVATVVLGLSGGLYLINEKQKETEAARKAEKLQREEAERAQKAARAAEVKEREQRQTAERRLEALKSTFNTMINNMSGEMRTAPNRSTQEAHRRLLASMLEDIEALRAQSKRDDRVLALFNGDALYELGSVCTRLRQFERAQAYFDQAEALIAERLRAAPGDRELRRERARLLLGRKELARYQKQRARVEALCAQAVKERRAILAESPEQLRDKEELAWALVCQGMACFELANVPRSLELYKEGMRLAREVLGREARSPLSLRALVLGAYTLGTNALDDDRLDEAESALREGVAAGRSLSKRAATRVFGEQQMAMGLCALGEVATKRQQLTKAYQLYAEAKARMDRLAAMGYDMIEERDKITVTFERMARDFTKRGQDEQALEAMLVSLDSRRARLALQPRDPELLYRSYVVLANIGRIYRSQKKQAEARPILEEAVSVLERLRAAAPGDRRARVGQRIVYRDLAKTCEALRLPAAAANYAAAIAVSRTLAEDSEHAAPDRRYLALALARDARFHWRQKQLKRALVSGREAAELSRELALKSPESPLLVFDHAHAQRTLGEIERDLQNYEQARVHFLEALEQRRRRATLLPSNGSALRDVSFALERLGGLAALQGDHKEAATRYRESLKVEQAAALITRRYLKTERRLKELAEKHEALAKTSEPGG